jgi:hypothetical protein
VTAIGPDPSVDPDAIDLTDLDRLLDGASLLGITAMSNVTGLSLPACVTWLITPTSRAVSARRASPSEIFAR